MREHRAWPWTVLVPLIVAQLWAAHAVAFFAHEYAHAFVAWGLGWKRNSLDIHYAKPSIIVFLIQLGINENVDYGPIQAAGRGGDVALIAVAGCLLGNALFTYPLGRLAYHRAQADDRRGWGMLAFWVTAASVGNLIDYVPIRTFTDGGGDMGTLEKGLGWSPWVVLLVLGVPTLAATLHFFLKIVPETMSWLFPHAPNARFAVAVLAVFAVFGFYGAVGLLEGGPVSHDLSLASILVVLPLMAVAEILLINRPPRGAAILPRRARHPG